MLLRMAVTPDMKGHCWSCNLVKTLAKSSDFSKKISFELPTMASQRLNLFLNGLNKNFTLFLNQRGDLIYFQTFLWLVSQKCHLTVLTQLSEGASLIKCSLYQRRRKENFISLLTRELLQMVSGLLVYVLAQIWLLSLYHLYSLILLIWAFEVIMERY